jgi:hypothetical protein
MEASATGGALLGTRRHERVGHDRQADGSEDPGASHESRTDAVEAEGSGGLHCSSGQRSSLAATFGSGFHSIFQGPRNLFPRAVPRAIGTLSSDAGRPGDPHRTDRDPEPR